jgi:hypothetical protein
MMRHRSLTNPARCADLPRRPMPEIGAIALLGDDLDRAGFQVVPAAHD